MDCPQCGTSLPDNTPFCSVCGRAQTPAIPFSPIAPPPPGTLAAPMPPTQTSGKAIVSLVLGIVPLSIFSSIPAVVLGHMALSDIKRAGGRLGGRGLAIAGLVLGYLGIALCLVMIPLMLAIAIPNLMRARIAANESSAVGSIRTINAAQLRYQSTYAAVGYAPDLRSLGAAGAGCGAPNPRRACLIDDSLASATTPPGKHGYTFLLQGQGAQYFAAAVPVARHRTGRRSFCSVEDGLVRVDDSGGGISDRAACAALPSLE
jgi:type IV pilus assembly protein PilA